MNKEQNENAQESGRVLVADDYPLNRMKLAQILELQGHTAVLAENGREALDLMRREAFDVVLLDIIMPEMDGYQVLEIMSADNKLKDIPVIVISSVDDIESIVRCIELGAVDYLAKPFNPTILQARLETSLQRKKLRDLERSYLEQEIMLRQSEKLATLGRLSAGMAHELNNPAAAASRATDQLRMAVKNLEESNIALNRLGLAGAQYEALLTLKQRREEQMMSALDRSEREMALESCLDAHGLEDAWQMAPVLVNMGYTEETLNDLTGTFDRAQIPPILTWLCATTNVHGLLAEISEGTSRIAELIGVLKMYSFMDQAPVQAVDVNEGLENTLVLLKSKIGPGIVVRRDYAADLPRIDAYGSELNQVWTHVIDNALDAVDGEGEIRISTRQEGEWVVVEVADDGPGIAEADQAQVFDPFFTTKPPGSGTGLGLNVSHHIVVNKHGGQISFRSRPGRTVFVIRLPLHGVD
ncbi:MAG: response regulator [Candidatus Promineifilaceae bacterium]|nr:response regulator [Candidatus Promineifilaceae bacterium]